MSVNIPLWLENVYEEVYPGEFYRELFPEGSFEKRGVMDPPKCNGIALRIKQETKYPIHSVITDDLEEIDEIVDSDDFCIMSPISYIGNRRTASNARYIYALAIDLDGITTDSRFSFFLTQCEEGDKMLAVVWGLPKPTYLVSSGTGIHIYYFFEEPIRLYPNVISELEKLKKRLTWQAWTQGASQLHDHVQYESLFQGFRMVGSITKIGTRVRAFKVGEKVTVDYLNQFVPDDIEYRADFTLSHRKIILDKAKEKYPEWYEKRIVKKQPKKSWRCNRAVYDWWKKRIVAKGEEGHRYWCIMVLATYAIKCGIGKEELERDAYELMPLLSSRGKNPFTEDDVEHALEAFDNRYVTYPIKAISVRTGIPIEKNKRNGRKQEVHLAAARAVQKVLNEASGNNWRENNGRKPKKDIVIEWRKDHPEGRKVDCIRDTGLTKPTVYKWWND